MVVHDPEREMFKCVTCGYEYTSLGVLKVHQRAKHPEVFPELEILAQCFYSRTLLQLLPHFSITIT